MCAHAHIATHTHVYSRACVCSHTCIHTRAHIQTHIYTHVHAHIHRYTQIHKHTYSHTGTHAPLMPRRCTALHTLFLFWAFYFMDGCFSTRETKQETQRQRERREGSWRKARGRKLNNRRCTSLLKIECPPLSLASLETALRLGCGPVHVRGCQGACALHRGDSGAQSKGSELLGHCY